MKRTKRRDGKDAPEDVMYRMRMSIAGSLRRGKKRKR